MPFRAPSWAKNRRPELLRELEQWCTARGIPLTVDEKAWVAPPEAPNLGFSSSPIVHLGRSKRRGGAS
jgi:hypothetical protein